MTLAAADPQRLLSAGTTFSSLTGRMGHRGAGESYPFGQQLPTRSVDAVDGCAMLMKRQLLEEVGLFDEDYFFTFEDLDLCLRSRRAGYTTLSVGDAIVYHQASRSIGAGSIRRLYFAARNHLLVAARQAPANAIASLLRGGLIVALNLAHALLRFPTSPVAGVHAVARGTLDHLRRRYGADG